MILVSSVHISYTDAISCRDEKYAWQRKGRETEEGKRR